MEDARGCSARSILTRANVLLFATAGTKVEDARGLLESAVHFSESTFKAVWDGSIQEQPAKLQGEAAGSLGCSNPASPTDRRRQHCRRCSAPPSAGAAGCTAVRGVHAAALCGPCTAGGKWPGFEKFGHAAGAAGLHLTVWD